MANTNHSNRQYDYYAGREAPEAGKKHQVITRYVLLLLCIVGFIALPWLFLGVNPDPKTPDSMKGEEQAKAFAAHRQWENDRLNSYGWTDREKNLIHIPIDKAMKLTLEQKLPVRKMEPAAKIENK